MKGVLVFLVSVLLFLIGVGCVILLLQIIIEALVTQR